jgi:hypothetical protein
MHQFLADVIDQLDLAIDQLAVSDRNFDRFAMMLVDNVVELTLHRYFRDRAGENDLYKDLSGAKFDPKIVKSGLGRNFDEKIRAARKLEFIDEAQCESLLNLHRFRNTAYHGGLYHEGILHSLAVFYFRNACDLLLRYKPTSMGWGSDDVVSHRARKYLGEAADGRILGGGGREPYSEAFQRLHLVASRMPCNLVEALASDMEETIRRTDEVIQFLADGGPEKRSRDYVVLEAQAWSVAFTDEAKKLAAERRHKIETMQGYIDWLTENINFGSSSDPVLGWKERQRHLAQESDEHKALKQYCDFIRQTEATRDSLVDAAMALEQHIDEQIDRIRGK